VKTLNKRATGAFLAIAVLCLSACTDNPPLNPDAGTLPQTLFVASESAIASYEIATGIERPGTLTGVSKAVNMQVLDEGTVLVNLEGSNQILALDSKTMVEKARIASSADTGTRPVHSFITPKHNGKQYWVALNDGDGTLPTNRARFIDVNPTSSTYLTAVGEVALGTGHHKAAFSHTRERAVISNIADCDAVVTVFDYSDVANIQVVASWSAAQLGWDGSSPDRTCSPNFIPATSGPVSPHGCATAKESGKIYCNLTSSGEIVAIDVNAEVPGLEQLATNGTGSGYTYAHPDGRYIYSVQETPREGSGGVPCQSGQLVVVDATTDTVVNQIPLKYKGPDCTTALSGTDEDNAEPGHILITRDKQTMYVGLAGAFGQASARVRQQLVLSLTAPEAPVQQASITVGASTGHHEDTISGDGKFLFVANNVDNTVTQIDVSTNTVIRTLPVRNGPRSVATFGTLEGPSYQTGPVK